MRKPTTVATIPALPVDTMPPLPVDTVATIDAVSPCISDKSADNPTPDSIDNPIIDLIDNTTITHIKSNHEIAIEKLSESEALLNDAILQFEAAKLSVRNATTAPQPVVNMDVLDLESEAIRVAAIEAKLSLNCRTAELVLIARRQRVQNAVKAVKNAVENVNEEVSNLLQNRMVECETHLTQNLLGLNEFRQVAAALGWRSGSLSEAAALIERDYSPLLPDVTLPRRVATPNCLALADTALNGAPVAPKPVEGQLADGSLFNPTSNGRIQPDGVQELAEQYRETLRVDGLIQSVVDRHDNRKFTTAPAKRMDMRLGGFVNVTLPTGGAVVAY